MTINKQKIYIAGPYSRGDIMLNIRYAIDIGNRLFEFGFIPFIPHLTGFWHIMFPHAYEQWMDYDAEWLKSCDAVIRLEGSSSGADKEIQMAESLDIPVFYDVAQLIGYFMEKP